MKDFKNFEDVKTAIDWIIYYSKFNYGYFEPETLRTIIDIMLGSKKDFVIYNKSFTSFAVTFDISIIIKSNKFIYAKRINGKSEIYSKHLKC